MNEGRGEGTEKKSVGADLVSALALFWGKWYVAPALSPSRRGMSRSDRGSATPACGGQTPGASRHFLKRGFGGLAYFCHPVWYVKTCRCPIFEHFCSKIGHCKHMSTIHPGFALAHKNAECQFWADTRSAPTNASRPPSGAARHLPP